MIVNEYETTYVARPDLAEDVLTKLTDKLAGIVAANGGTVLVAEDWGKRKLAFTVKRQARGHYLYLDYVGPASLVAEIERNLRLEDDLLRFLTVRIEADVEVAARQALAEDRKRLRIERMAAQKAEEEAEARYRAEAEDEEGEPVVDDE
jgi:small subunit ribosomal protein S6